MDGNGTPAVGMIKIIAGEMNILLTLHRKEASYILMSKLNLMQIFYWKMLLKVRLHGQLTVAT